MVDVRNKKVLKNVLDLVKASEAAYSLEGGLPNEALCIDKETNKWIVYYSERGKRTNPVSFTTEKEACSYFFSLYLETRQIDLEKYPYSKNRVSRFLYQKSFKKKLQKAIGKENKP